MKTQIRKHVFETNSSSVHSLCIYMDRPDDFKLPDEVDIYPGQFGWEHESYSSVQSKLSYVYQMCKEVDEAYEYSRDKDRANPYFKNYAEAQGIPEGQVARLVKILEDAGIEVHLHEPEKGAYSWDSGYIDHGDEWFPYLDDFLSDTNKLFNFLFLSMSEVQTGNDNDDSCSCVGQVPAKYADKYEIISK